MIAFHMAFVFLRLPLLSFFSHEVLRVKRGAKSHGNCRICKQTEKMLMVGSLDDVKKMNDEHGGKPRSSDHSRGRVFKDSVVLV